MKVFKATVLVEGEDETTVTDALNLVEEPNITAVESVTEFADIEEDDDEELEEEDKE